MAEESWEEETLRHLHDAVAWTTPNYTLWSSEKINDQLAKAQGEVSHAIKLILEGKK